MNRHVTSTVRDLWHRFEGAPDLRLTLEQAVEWLDADPADVEEILAAFVAARVLRRIDDGVYVRCANG